MIRVARAAIVVGDRRWRRRRRRTAAWALCPNCLAQRQTLTPTLELLGLFLLVPFAVAAIAIWVVRRALYGRSRGARRRRAAIAVGPVGAAVERRAATRAVD